MNKRNIWFWLLKSTSWDDIHGNMKACSKDNYEAHNWIFNIFWKKILNIRVLRIFKLLKKNYSKLGTENSTSAKALSQGIQRDQFHYFWSYILEDTKFWRLMYLLKNNKKNKNSATVPEGTIASMVLTITIIWMIRTLDHHLGSDSQFLV